MRMFFKIFFTEEPIPDINCREFVYQYTDNEEVLHVLDSALRYANGVEIGDASAVDVVTSLRLQNRRFEGIIIGGNRALIEELKRKILSQGGEILTKCPAARMRVERGRAVAVMDEDGKEHEAEIVVCNADPRTALRLLGEKAPGELRSLAERFEPACGVTYCVGTSEPLVPHDGVEIPYGFGGGIAGYCQVSNADPSLAPPGRHLLLAYQPIDYTLNVEHSIEQGKRALGQIFPALKANDIFHVSVFQKDWPAAFVQQKMGQYGCSRLPLRFREIENLYFLSHSSCGYGLAAEIIGDAALKFQAALSAKEE